MENEMIKSIETITDIFDEERYQLIINEEDLPVQNIMTMPLSNLLALGSAFEPIASTISSFKGSGESGIYFVNTMGKQMFQVKNGKEFIGSLKTLDGTVGGGQARLTQLPCDPTMMCVALAIMHIEQKLDDIREVQTDILRFIELKEKAEIKGNIDSMLDVLKHYKSNYTNKFYIKERYDAAFKMNDSAKNKIIFYQDLIKEYRKKQALIHDDNQVKKLISKLEEYLQNYQLSLYLFSLSSLVLSLLNEQHSSEYLRSIISKIEDYSLEYRLLYTDCYNMLENYQKTSIQSNVIEGLSVASKFMSKTIEKIPVINKTQIDENLLKVGDNLKDYSTDRKVKSLERLVKNSSTIVRPFVESIKMIDLLHNEEILYRIEDDNMQVSRLIN